MFGLSGMRSHAMSSAQVRPANNQAITNQKSRDLLQESGTGLLADPTQERHFDLRCLHYHFTVEEPAHLVELLVFLSTPIDKSILTPDQSIFEGESRKFRSSARSQLVH